MKKILVIDDEKKIRDIYKKLLEDEGYGFIEAPSANYANEVLLREDVDLILLDIKMPNVEGDVMYDVIKMFHRRSKVIVSSVYPLEEQKRLISGADDYFDKSQGLEFLLFKIKQALGNGALV